MFDKLTARLNPEFVRIIRTSLTPKRALFIAATTVALLMVGGMLLWNNWAYWFAKSESYRASYDLTQKFGEDAFDKLTVILFALMFVLAPAMAALSFVQERMRGTAIFQQMVLLRPFDLVLGKFLGSTAVSYFIAALVLPFYFTAAALGQLSGMKVMRLGLLLVFGGLCCQAVGIAVSAILSGPTERALRGGLLVGPAVGGAGAVVALVTYDLFTRSWYLARSWSFYGQELYPYQVALILFAFVGAWAFAGAVRQTKASQLIPTKPRTVWLFFASAEALLVGLFWGWEQYARDGSQPFGGLIFYLTLNGLALLALAGASSLSRDRLREWWSAARDPLTIFQRREIKNAAKTYLVALMIAEAGLCALWLSYHAGLSSFPENLSVVSQLLPIGLGFAAVALGAAAFTQFCALQRFRLGGYAGVLFTLVFFVTMLLAGVSFNDKNNTPMLVNPVTYAPAILDGDRYMDEIKYTIYKESDLNFTTNDEAIKRGYERTDRPDAATLRAMTLHGLIAQLVLAQLCFGAVVLKWRATREAILREA